MRRAHTLLAALAALALAASPDASAKKERGKGKKKGHARVLHVDSARRGPPADLAALVAARPRLPDGSRIVLRMPPRPPTPRSTTGPRAPSVPSPTPDAVVARRRAAAVDAYLGRHAPPR